MNVMSLADRVWPISRLAIGAHARIYRVSNGLIGHRFPGAPPMLLLDHVGAKTGTRRTTPLVYVEDDRDVVIVASKGGHPRNPAWWTFEAPASSAIAVAAPVRCAETQRHRGGLLLEPRSSARRPRITQSGAAEPHPSLDASIARAPGSGSSSRL